MNSRVFAAFLIYFLGAALAHAQPAIQSISTSVRDGSDVVKVEVSEPIEVAPASFSVQSPARVVLDFLGYINGTGKTSTDVAQGNMRSFAIVQASDRTRLVLNLKNSTGYRTVVEGKVVWIYMDPISSTTKVLSTNFAENKNKNITELQDVDFRRSADGSGRVVVKLPNNQVGVDIRQEGRQLIVDFMKSKVPDSLKRKLDVSDFATPVRFVSVSQVGDVVRVVVEPQGVWEHSAYQSDEQFVLEVKEVKTDPRKLTQGPGYNGQKLSLNFQSIEIRSLLQVIADFTNFNIITSDSVTGSVTLRLQDVPWDQALDIILQSKGLGMRKNGNVLWVAPKDEIAAKEKLELENVVAVQSLEPLRTQSFQINYAKAADIAAGLIGSGSGSAAGASRILTTRGSVIFETRTNQLFVTDIPSKLEQVQQLISKIDIAVRQVLIEARIVEASDTFGKSLGARLGGGSSNSAGSIGTYSSSSSGLSAGSFVSLAATGTSSSSSVGTLALSIFGAGSDSILNLEISALESDGKGKVVSNPRVITADQVKALIEQGTELPYQVASSSGATSIAFRKANLKLEVTPQITPEGNIILTLDVTKDSVGQSTSAGFAIDTKHIQTQVLVENGGTVVIGGIYTEEVTDQVNKIPFFGDLPGIGVLFRNTSKASTKKELLVFITPKVLSEKALAR
ncbi:type IV pilus secretin PilQ [Curvibacter sp. CHRR-16]|uniref:type IV pilus secretin PilQ n=1 Tax=Curvibacter sp. CHRR-16 TaxID=2835872 RepID=UPI002023B7FF|nr:type IV pilus secretin PilQ [Curvibacter sp. CHRR-16]